MKTYRAYRRAGLSRLAGIRGQMHAIKLWIVYAPGNFRYWWFWQVYMRVLARSNPAKCKQILDRLRAAIDSLKGI